MTSGFVYKVMGLTFHDRINIQLIYKIEIAQVVARRNTKPQRTFLGSNLTGCSFLFIFLRGGGGEGGRYDFIILFMSSSFLSFYLFIFLLFFFYF